MRALLLADRSLATREHSMLRRLEIGLVDDGIRLVRAVPASVPAEATTGLAGTVGYDDGRWRLGRPSPATTILRALGAMETLSASVPSERPDAPIDLVHAFGEECWPAAAEIAIETGADLLIEVWSGSALTRMRSMERLSGELESAGAGASWLAPSQSLAVAAERQAQRWPVRPSAWGVHVPVQPVSHGQAGRPLALTVMASGRDPKATCAALTGLSASLRSGGQDVLIFLDGAGVETHLEVWKHAERLHLLDRLSVIEGVESRREMVLQTNILIQPEHAGEHRTILLEAMAAGMVVVARSDPLVGWLEDSRTALLVEDGLPAAWEVAFGRLLTDAELVRQIALEARQRVSTSHLAHQHVRATLDAYRAASDQRPIAFTGSSPS